MQFIRKAEPRFDMFFPGYRWLVLNDFVLFLKQESGSRLEASRFEGSKGSKDEKGIQQGVVREVEGKGIFNFFQIQEI